MFILHFFSDGFIQFIVHAVLAVGIVGTVLTFVVLNRVLLLMPFLAPYYQALRAISVIFLIAGIYLEGGYATEMAWRERVTEVEARLAEAQQQSNKLNDELEAMAKKKVQYIRGRTEYITRYIDKDVAKYDDRFSKNGMCAIPPEFVKAHNDAAARPRNK